MAVSKIDWAFWFAMPEVKIWQAIALSLDIDPNKLRTYKTGISPMRRRSAVNMDTVHFANSHIRDEFDKRCRLLIANISDRRFFTAGTLNLVSPISHGVKLAEVAKWLLSLRREPIAAGLLQAIANAPPAPTADIPGASRTLKLTVEALLQELRADCSKGTRGQFTAEMDQNELLKFILREEQQQTIEIRSPDGYGPFPLDEWIITGEDMGRLREAISSRIDYLSHKTDEARRASAERNAAAEQEKIAAGRYTLEEAATAISKSTGESKKQLLEKLKDAAASHTLRMYGPGSKQVLRYRTEHASRVREYSDEAYWGDLNAWLRLNEPRITTFEFTEPQVVTPAKAKRTTTKQQQMNREFLRVISKLGHDPKALPAKKSGCPGMRSEVARALGRRPSDKDFARAWDRALSDNVLSFAGTELRDPQL